MINLISAILDSLILSVIHNELNHFTVIICNLAKINIKSYKEILNEIYLAYTKFFKYNREKTMEK